MAPGEPTALFSFLGTPQVQQRAVGEVMGTGNSKEEGQDVERREENPEVGCLHPRNKGNAEILW